MWAAAISECKRVRVAVDGAELTARRSFVRHGADVGGAPLPPRLFDVRECATRASCTLTDVYTGGKKTNSTTNLYIKLYLYSSFLLPIINTDDYNKYISLIQA